MNARDERDCPRYEEAVAWTLHALEPDEELQFLEHLPECASCQAAVRDTEEVLAGLGASVEQVDPPPALRGALLARVAETPQQPRVERTEPDPAPEAAPAPRAVPRRTDPAPSRGSGWLARRGRRLAVAATALAAVLAVGGLVVRNAQLEQQPEAGTAQAQSVDELIEELDRPGARHAVLSTDDGTAVAAVLVAGGRHEVYAVGMPPNPTDRTYVLWGIAAGSAPQPLGTFDVTEADGSPHAVEAGGDAGEFTHYAISLEPGRAAPPAPSSVMAQGQVAT